jgi:hypothetical protein
MKTFHRCLCFTSVPLKGHYRYRDEFQIFPANFSGMPESKFQKHFPALLEYWITPEEKIKTSDEWGRLEGLFSGYAAQFRKEDKILTLLSTFSNNRFFKYSMSSSNWGLPMLTDDPGEEVNEQSSKWCMKTYYFPELGKQFGISEFSLVDCDDVALIKHKPYYLFDPNVDFDEKKDITFPDSIDKMFDAYFKLDNEITQVINTACSYIVSAMELYGQRNTMSLLSCFTAMETMVNLEFRGDKPARCETCGQPQHKVSAKFAEYLLKYIGRSQNNKKKFNSYYALRSKIVHAGKQLKTESLFADVSKEEQGKELLTRIEVLQTSRLAVVNWLLINDLIVD